MSLNWNETEELDRILESKEISISKANEDAEKRFIVMSTQLQAFSNMKIEVKLCV